MPEAPRHVARCFPPLVRPAFEGEPSHIFSGEPAAFESVPWSSDALHLGLSDDACVAISGLLPAMVCGEESAVLVFENESRRVQGDLFAHSNATLARISREEEGHEQILRALASGLPAADHEPKVRRMARRFFAGLHTPNIGEHFSRIAWLDSGVCLIFARLHASPLLKDAAPLRHAVRRILREEASHVAFSRRYAQHLDVDMLQDRESFLRVRGGLVHVLEPCAGALDALEIDAAALFKALKQRAFDGDTP